MSPIRDRDRERRFIAAASPTDPRWLVAVTTRLDVGQRLYGNDWATRPLVDLIREIDEEALDIAPRSVLALQALDRTDLGASDRDRIAHLLARATREAAQIHDRLRTARRIACPPTNRNGEPDAQRRPRPHPR